MVLKKNVNMYCIREASLLVSLSLLSLLIAKRRKKMELGMKIVRKFPETNVKGFGSICYFSCSQSVSQSVIKMIVLINSIMVSKGLY